MADPAFNILSLCSGVGMLDEGVGLAVPGGRTVCYIERESGAAAILLARMGDKALEPAPVWCGNLEDFDVCPWAHALDCVTAGFPCQPHSQAGARKSVEDERWIWPAIADLIRRILKARDAAGEIRPFRVFLENVRGLLTSGDGGAFAQVLADLADMGFDAEWGLLSAAEVGASHQRERVFILGIRLRIRSLDSSSERRRVDSGSGQHAAAPRVEAFCESEPGSGDVADASRIGSEPRSGRQRILDSSSPLAHANGCRRWEQGNGSDEGRTTASGDAMGDSASPRSSDGENTGPNCHDAGEDRCGSIESERTSFSMANPRSKRLQKRTGGGQQ